MVASLLALPSALVGQQASYTVFGAPCVPFLGFPYFVPQGLPKLGATMQLQVASSTSHSLSFLVTGASRTQWGGLALPAQLVVPGFRPSCGLLHTSIDIALPVPSRASVQPVPMPFVIPNDSTLAGLSYFQQCMVFSSDPVASYLSMSAAGQAVIGI